jgi:hypothetical protein
MKKFLQLTLVACTALLVTASVSQAGRRGGGCCCTTTVAPAPAVVVPAPPATAAAPQAYRSYSYQPQYNNYSSFERNWGGHAYENATNKALGRVN